MVLPFYFKLLRAFVLSVYLVFFDRELHLTCWFRRWSYKWIICSIPVATLLLHYWLYLWLNIKITLCVHLHLILCHNLLLCRHTPRHHRTWNCWLLYRLGISLLLLIVLLFSHYLLISLLQLLLMLLLNLGLLLLLCLNLLIFLILYLLFCSYFVVYLNVLLFLSGHQVLLTEEDITLDGTFRVHVFHSPLTF